MKAEDLLALNDEIAGMARAGLPLDQGLAALAKEMGRGPLRSATTDLATDLRDGLTLPQALEKQSGRIPPYYVGLVTAGMRTGRIADVLATLSTYAHTVVALRVTLLDALVYPAIVLVVGILLFGFVFGYVVPQFEKVFLDFGFPLPTITRLILLLGRQPALYLGAPVFALLGLFLGIWVACRTTYRGRLLWAQFLYSIPVLGTLLRAARLASFTELLAILVDHEVPLPEAFLLAGEASSDPVMADAARQIHHELTLGEPLGKVLRGRGLVPEWLSWMTSFGERQGKMGETLHHIATMYRRKVEVRAGMLKNTLPAFLIIVVAGLFVALFVFAMMLPLIRLLDGLSK